MILMSTSGKILLWGGLSIVVVIAISSRMDRASGPLPGSEPAAMPGRYLDSRTGAALERTVKQVISSAGYDCDSIRTIGHMEADFVARLDAKDGRWVDCNEDGVFGVIESADGFRAVKR